MIKTSLKNTFLVKSYYLALLMRWHRPTGALLLLWPTLWALWLASHGMPSPTLLVVFVSGVLLMRSAGCIINDLADRRFDAHVTRTKNRPLVSGQVSPREALVLFSVLCALSCSLLIFLNPLTRCLAIPAIVLAILYPFMKRYTHLPQCILGLAFSWGIPMAFAAQTNQVPPIAWLLFLISAIWAIAYDTIYAMVDRSDDVLIGVKSTAILFGSWDNKIIGMLHVVMLALLIIVGYALQLNIFYYLGVMCAACVMLYQQYLIHHRESAQCLRAFTLSHWAGFAVFVGFMCSKGLLTISPL